MNSNNLKKIQFKIIRKNTGIKHDFEELLKICIFF